MAYDPQDQELEPQQEGQEPEGGEEKEPQQEAPQQQPERPQKPDGYVPHEALHEAKEREKQARQRADLLEQRFMELLNTRAQETTQARAPEQPKEPEQPPVSFEDNPAEFLRWSQEQERKALEQRLRPIEEFTQTRHQEIQQQQAQEQLLGAIRAQEAEFVQSGREDYLQAVQHLTQQQIADHVAMGWDPQSANKVVSDMQLAAAYRCLQQGRNPAEVAYELAKRRGYQGPEQRQGNGATAPQQQAQQQTQQQQTQDQQMQDFERQAARSGEARTLGSMSGNQGGGRQLVSKIADMSTEEFQRFKEDWQKTHPGRSFKDLLGSLAEK